MRTLLVHQADGCRERGVAFSLSYNPTPSTPLGFAARVAPSWGSQATGGAEALWGHETMAAMAHGGLAQGGRLDGEVGYSDTQGSIARDLIGDTQPEVYRVETYLAGPWILQALHAGRTLGANVRYQCTPD